MNKAAKKFIEKKLIPFVQREAGNGFAMSTWKQPYTQQDIDANFGAKEEFDSVEHRVPACGTVACLGGSIQVLTGKRGMGPLSKAIGLSKDAADGLFYNWLSGDINPQGYGWPTKFAVAFGKAKTPRGKAGVAVRLLREVIRTNGECLHVEKAG